MGDATGDGNPGDGEGPVHEVRLSPFSIDVTSVTNADFACFVDATGFSTEAEDFGFSAVFHLALAARPDEVMGSAAGTPWWLGVRGADWRHPGGSLSGIDELDEYRRPPQLERRVGLLLLGRPAAPDGGRVGVRLPGWPRGGALPLGRRPAGWQEVAVQHLAGTVPGPQRPG